MHHASPAAGENATVGITGARVAKLLMIVSSARTIRLADGTDHPTGYRAEEVRKP